MYSTPQEVFSAFGEHMLSVVVQELESYVTTDSGNNCICDIVYLPSSNLILNLPTRSWSHLVELVNQNSDRMTFLPLEKVSSLYNPLVCQKAISIFEHTLYQSPFQSQSQSMNEGVPVIPDDYVHYSVSLKYIDIMNKYISSSNGYGNSSSPSTNTNNTQSSSSVNATIAAMEGGVPHSDSISQEEEFLTEYVNDWLTCVNDHMLGCILVEIFSIPSLCVAGLFQLKTDVNYIMYVLCLLCLYICIVCCICMYWSSAYCHCTHLHIPINLPLTINL